MSFPSLRLALLAGLALPLGLATASLATVGLAQDAPVAHSGGDADAHHDHMRDPAQMRAHMAEHIATVLQLQSSQQGALDAFLDAVTPPAGMNERMEHGDADEEHLTAPQRMDHMLAHIDQMRAHVAAADEATKRFYGQLTPSQQKAFDELAPMMMHHMGGGHGGDHGEMMEHGHHGAGEGHEMGPGD